MFSFIYRAEGKGPLVTPRDSWEDNIKLNLKEIGFEGVDWMLVNKDGIQWGRGTYVRTEFFFMA
jgi:hypothetical protein